MADLGQSTIYGLTVATDLDVKGITTVRELRTINTFVVAGIPDESTGTDGSASFQLERRDINNNYLDNFRVVNIKESETSNLGVLKFQKQIGENGGYEDIFSIDTEKSLIVENNIDVKGEVIGKVSSLTATINDSASDARGVYFYTKGDADGSGKLLYSNNFTYTPNSKTLEVGNITTTSNAAVGGTLTVSGAATLNKTLNVTGNTALNATTINTTLAVTGATTLGSTLSVSGVTTLDNTLTVTGATTLKSTLGVSSNTTIGGTLDVTSKTTLATLSAGTTTLSSLSVTSNSSLTGTLTVSGSSSLSTLSTSGLATLKSLSVTGNSTLTGNLDVTGATTVGSHVIPSTPNSCNLGSRDKYFSNIYSTTFTGALSGNASTASKLATAVTISLSGAVNGSKPFDGSSNIDISTTLADLASDKVTALTGYSKASTYSAITTSDSLNTAIGKLEKNFSNYLPLAGGPLTGNISFSNADIGATRGITGNIAGSDQWRIVGGATSSDSGYVEIATADNGNEPIYVRQYSSAFSTGTVKRTATLLDANGNTKFPGTVTAATFSGDLNGTAINASAVQVTTDVSADTSYYLTGVHQYDQGSIPLRATSAVYMKDSSVYANGFYATSSRKYKENIEKTSSSALDIIKQTEVVNFNYINDENKTPKIGIIAEDAPDILVSPDKGSVDTSNCIGVLLKACQELNERVEALEKEVTELKRKKSLKERIFGVKKNG